MVLRCSPKLDKRGDELALIALGADMSQADNEVVLQQALYDDIAVYSREVEVDGELIDHFQLPVAHVVLQDRIELVLRNILDSPVLDELFQHLL